MERNLPPMRADQLTAYLKKLGVGGGVKPDLDTLKRLQHAQMLSIPYENLDSINGKVTSLEHEDLFQKMIVGNRGGICFELNGLYNWLLESVGFCVKSHAARFIFKDEEYQMRRHRVMTVALDGRRYLTDGGINSECARFPLLLEEGTVQSDGKNEYRFSRHEFWGWLLWQREPGKEWKRIYGFTEEPQMDFDFIMPTVFCDLHPLSPINKQKKISIYTEELNITIRWNELRFYAEGKLQDRRLIRSAEELREILLKYFRIDAPAEALTEKVYPGYLG